jgi:hypothetical protein
MHIKVIEEGPGVGVFSILDGSVEFRVRVWYSDETANELTIQCRAIGESWNEGTKLMAIGWSQEGMIEFAHKCEQLHGVKGMFVPLVSRVSSVPAPTA